jgi:hypothetical protein
VLHQVKDDERSPGIAEGGLEDHWDRPAVQRPQPWAVVLGDRHTEVWFEADDAQLGNEQALGQETLRLPENCVKTNGSPATGSISEGNVFREKVNTNRSAPGLATRLTERSPELRRRVREVPDAVRDEQLEAAVPGRDLVHWREDQGQAPASPILLSVRRGGAKHGPRQVETEDVPPEPCQGDRIAAGATAKVERPAIPTALPLLFGEPQQHGVRRRLGEPGDGLQGPPRGAGERIHARNVASINPMRLHSLA